MRSQVSRVALVSVLVLHGAGFSRPLGARQSRQWAVSTNQTQEPVVGLLDLPEIVGDGCGQVPATSVDVYSAPSTKSTPLGSIRLLVPDRQADGGACGSAQLVLRRVDGGADEELPTDESGYEVLAAIVYQRSALWFRIALPRESGWVLRASDADFAPFPGLLRDKLAYLRTGWNGSWWPTPGAGSATRVPAAWTQYLRDDIPVDVLDIRFVQNRPWLHIRLKIESCGETLEGVTPLTGWIPAYGPSGRPSVWFHARGC